VSVSSTRHGTHTHYQLIMDTNITLTGWIKSCQIQEAEECFENEVTKYRLVLEPFDNCFSDIERRVLEMKDDRAMRLERPINADDQCFKVLLKDNLFDGCRVLFETIRKPTLQSYLRNYSDEQLTGCFVKILGNIKLHSGGNAYLSVHNIEPQEPEKDDVVVEADPNADW